MYCQYIPGYREEKTEFKITFENEIEVDKFLDLLEIGHEKNGGCPLCIMYTKIKKNIKSPWYVFTRLDTI